MLFTTAAVFLLSWSGKRIERRFIVLGMLACLCYCLSDTSIKVLVGHFEFMGPLAGASMAAARATSLAVIAEGEDSIGAD